MIGVFDSGVGGLSVLREIWEQLPNEDTIYFADTAHCPYGSRSIEEVRSLAVAITDFLVGRGAKVIVVACNTASAAALHHLRERFAVPIVGMEPAVKPAVEHTHTGRVGVIATEVTFQGELFARLLDRFATGVDVKTQVCPGLVQQVEAAKLDDPETDRLLRLYLQPMVAAGIDSLALGCTHYPFLRDAIQRVVGPDVEIIDPAPAVARQTARVLEQNGLLRSASEPAQRLFYTTGDPAAFAAMAERLLGVRIDIEQSQLV
jgi:glutamate racemase